MLIVNYNSSYGQPIRDGQVAEFANKAFYKSQMPNRKKKCLFSILIASKAVFREFQKMVNQGTIPANAIQFKYENHKIRLNKNGQFALHKNHELMKG